MERPLVVVFLLVGCACAYEWHFGNDNENYIYIEYLEGNIWPLHKSTRLTISVPPCMLVKYVWVGVINLVSNPSVSYNKDTFTVVIEYGVLASSTSGYHVVAKGMRDPACGGGGTGGGDPHCPIAVCPPIHCPVVNCPPPNCLLPNEPPRCPPPNCPPVYCPPMRCPPPNCPRANCPPAFCPPPNCPPPQCHPPYVPARCPPAHCHACPQPQCGPQTNPYANRQYLSGKKTKKSNVVKLAGDQKSTISRQRDQKVVLDYIDGIEIYNATGAFKKGYAVIDGDGNIVDREAYDFEDDVDSEDQTDSEESDNVKTAEVNKIESGDKHDMMLLIVSDKKGDKQVAGERNEGHSRGKGSHIGSRPTKRIIYTKNSRYNIGSGYDWDDYGRNSREATGSGKVKSIGYIKGVRYNWDNENAKKSVYSSRDRDEHKVTMNYGESRGNSGVSDDDNTDSDRDWGYGYDANIFSPGKESRGMGSSGNDGGSNKKEGRPLCRSYYNAKSGYGGNRGSGKGSTYTGNLCDEDTIDDGFVVLERGSGNERVDGQVLDGGY